MERSYPENELILVNETFFIDGSIEKEWLEYFHNQYLLSINQIIEFEQYIFSEINQKFDQGDKSFAFQFLIYTDKYNDQDAINIIESERLKHAQKFNKKAISIVTLMNVRKMELITN